MVGYKQLVFCLFCFLSLCAVAPTEEKQQFLHAVYRVRNLNRTIEFYKVCFGMKVLREEDVPKHKYSYAILGYGPESSHFVLKLIYKYGMDNFDVGTGSTHFGILTPNAYEMVEVVRANGGVITREPRLGIDGQVVFAFVVDPNGHSIEITQNDTLPTSLNHVNLHVTNIDRAINFYQRALGLNLLIKYDSPRENFTIALLSYGELNQATFLEFTYNYGATEIRKGNGYSHVAINSDDIYKSTKTVKSAVRKLGGKIIRSPLPKINTNNITSFIDPEGWKTVLVEK